MLSVVQEEDVDEDTLTTDTLSPETNDSSQSSDTQVSRFQPLFKHPFENDHDSFSSPKLSLSVIWLVYYYNMVDTNGSLGFLFSYDASI